MADNNEARIDKWLWAARIFKTRSIAADACKNGRVTIQGVNAKPSRPVKVGEVVKVRVLDVDVKRKRISLTMKL